MLVELMMEAVRGLEATQLYVPVSLKRTRVMFREPPVTSTLVLFLTLPKTLPLLLVNVQWKLAGTLPGLPLGEQSSCMSLPTPTRADGLTVTAYASLIPGGMELAGLKNILQS